MTPGWPPLAATSVWNTPAATRKGPSAGSRPRSSRGHSSLVMGDDTALNDLERGRDEDVVRDFYAYLLHSTAAQAFPEGVHFEERTAWGETIPRHRGRQLRAALRHMLIHETDDLGKPTVNCTFSRPSPIGGWRAGRTIIIERAPTRFGEMDFRIKGAATGVHVEGPRPRRSRPGRGNPSSSPKPPAHGPPSGCRSLLQTRPNPALGLRYGRPRIRKNRSADFLIHLSGPKSGTIIDTGGEERPDSLSRPGYPSAARMRPQEMAPGRRRRGAPPVKSTIVEGTPPGVRPPSTMRSMRPSNRRQTASGSSNLPSPDRLALVAVTGNPVRRSSIAKPGQGREREGRSCRRAPSISGGKDVRGLQDQGQRAGPERPGQDIQGRRHGPGRRGANLGRIGHNDRQGLAPVPLFKGIDLSPRPRQRNAFTPRP